MMENHERPTKKWVQTVAQRTYNATPVELKQLHAYCEERREKTPYMAEHEIWDGLARLFKTVGGV